MAPKRTPILTALILAVLTTLGCDSQRPAATEFLGLRIGMERPAAELRLNEIADFVSAEAKNQQIWDLKDKSRFKSVAIGYREDKVRYVTAFVDKEHARDRLAYTSVGNLTEARAEIVEPHYRYIWEIPASKNNDALSVVAYGDDPEFVTIFSLVARPHSQETAAAEPDEAKQ